MRKSIRKRMLLHTLMPPWAMQYRRWYIVRKTIHTTRTAYKKKRITASHAHKTQKATRKTPEICHRR